MLYQCSSCKTIEIPTSFFWYLNIRELDILCADSNSSSKNDPFSESFLDDGERVYKKNMKTSLDDIDYEEDQIEEDDKWVDTDYTVSIEWEE